MTRITCGNQQSLHTDYQDMRCSRCREAVSARLDGEPIGLSASALDDHLASCTDCARWAQQAARLTRVLRVGPADVPDLSQEITAGVVLPTQRVLRRVRVLRAALLLVGVAQLAIAVPALVGDSIGMVMSMHAAHEAAAWNLAMGAAFLAAAIRPRRAAGLIPLLATFIVVLAALSVHDFSSGAVSAARLATHVAALLGLLLLIAIERAVRALPPGSSGAGRGRRGDRGENPRLRDVA